MRKLVLYLRGEDPREFALLDERITIGRLPENGIAIEDKSVSGTHAAVITIGPNSYLQDLGSTNGTLVNGAPISKHSLRHGDAIVIGGTHFIYLDMPDVPAEAPKPPKPEFEFLPITSTRATLQAAPKPPSASDEDFIEQTIKIMKSHRTETDDKQKGNREEIIQQEWLKLLKHIEKLKAQIGHNPRVKYFAISRRNNDIMIRVPDSSGSREKLFVIAPHHPSGKSAEPAIWMSISGEHDRQFANAEDVATKLLSSLSHLL